MEFKKTDKLVIELTAEESQILQRTNDILAEIREKLSKEWENKKVKKEGLEVLIYRDENFYYEGCLTNQEISIDEIIAGALGYVIYCD